MLTTNSAATSSNSRAATGLTAVRVTGVAVGIRYVACGQLLLLYVLVIVHVRIEQIQVFSCDYSLYAYTFYDLLMLILHLNLVYCLSSVT